MEASFWKESGLKRFREWFREDDGQSLTPGQVTGAQQAIHLIQTEPFGTAIYDAMEVLVEAGWDNAADVFDVEAVLSDQAVPAWAYAAAKGNAKQLAYLVVERERAGLSALLEQAVANGSTAKDFAADISEYFAQGYHVLAAAGVHGFDGSNVIRKMATKPWSVTVARTELSRASNLGQMAFYHAAGIAQVEWAATLGIACCDECSDADGEVVSLGESFPFVDVDAPPAHPRCCCSTIPADADLGDMDISDEQRARAARGGYSAEDYEAKFGEKHPIDGGKKSRTIYGDDGGDDE